MMLAVQVLFASVIQLAPVSPGIEYKQPQIGVRGDLVALTFGSVNAVWFSGSKDGGRSFSLPVEVSRGGKMQLGRHRGPRIAIAGEAIVVSAVVGEKGGGADGDVLAWRSIDGGKTWSEGVRVNDVEASAREGLHGMASSRGRLTYAVWLDLRKPGMRLYGAGSRDGGATWSKNVLIYESPDGHICECCHPSVAVDGEDKVTVMWRNWLGGSRDMYLARSVDGGVTFGKAEKSGEGTWKLKACPMDGGGIALGPGREVAAVWRRMETIFLAYPGKPEHELGAGKDAAIAWGRKGVYTAWSGPHGLRAMLPGDSEPIHLAPKGAYVQLGGSDPVIAAWEQDGQIMVQPLSPKP
jgi:hypothetical protein